MLAMQCMYLCEELGMKLMKKNMNKCRIIYNLKKYVAIKKPAYYLVVSSSYLDYIWILIVLMELNPLKAFV